MARYIDINEIKFTGAVFEDRDGEIYIKLSDVKQSIEQTPTADVVEVVRCKDCKRCYEKRTKLNNQLMRFCMRMDGNEYKVNANDFCSYGTPKERGEEK